MKMNKADKILFAWIFIGLVAISWPSSYIPEIIDSKSIHTIAHIILFGILTILMNWSLIVRGMGQRFAAVLTLLGVSMYAGLSEIIQIFVPGRSCSIYNFYLDVFTSIVVLVLIYFRKCMQESN